MLRLPRKLNNLHLIAVYQSFAPPELFIVSFKCNDVRGAPGPLSIFLSRRLIMHARYPKDKISEGRLVSDE